jgi:hypothetical protein
MPPLKFREKGSAPKEIDANKATEDKRHRNWTILIVVFVGALMVLHWLNPSFGIF